MAFRCFRQMQRWFEVERYRTDYRQDPGQSRFEAGFDQNTEMINKCAIYTAYSPIGNFSIQRKCIIYSLQSAFFRLK